MLPNPDLMDTNIFIHLIRGDYTGQRIRADFDLFMAEVRPGYCTVTNGEMRSFALKKVWGHDRVDQMLFLLDYFVPYSHETLEIYAAYAAIDHYSESIGIKMGKNDLWIAAVASVTRFRLLTTDADFDHLDPLFLTRLRIAYDQDKESSVNVQT